MRNIHIYNPKAGLGKGKKKEGMQTGDSPSALSHVTTGIRDAGDFIREACKENPDTLFTVYGGDGTICEAVNGIMEAGAGETARLTVVPTGSGNDFVRNFPSSGEQKEYRIDLIDLDGMYAANVVNVGFDCSVVAKTDAMRANGLVTGGFSYILGVMAVLVEQYGIRLEVELTDESGDVSVCDGEFMLCAIANGAYYGGGFKAAPAASPESGVLDVILIRKISRARFLKLVGDYKAGRHVDAESGVPFDRFQDIVVYKKCLKAVVRGMEEVCVDGEVMKKKELVATPCPKAIRFLYPANASDILR
ncbi:MAG: hypothetical protein E7655_07090 [Ruminococcaceae bacterium]|nr:hypothetical protein [Oscillospiraceae bacterium]